MINVVKVDYIAKYLTRESVQTCLSNIPMKLWYKNSFELLITKIIISLTLVGRGENRNNFT